MWTDALTLSLVKKHHNTFKMHKMKPHFLHVIFVSISNISLLPLSTHTHFICTTYVHSSI